MTSVTPPMTPATPTTPTQTLHHQRPESQTVPHAQTPCWQSTGVWGDRTCTELDEVAHCHRCPTYAAAGTQLLHREMPPGYLSSQTAQVAALSSQVDASTLVRALIFRIGGDWLALPAGVCEQVLSPVKAHSLPHRSNQTLLGVVNVRGQLLLQVSLQEILNLRSPSAAPLFSQPLATMNQQPPQNAAVEVTATATSETATKTTVNTTASEMASKTASKVYPRMIVIFHSGDRWVFEADELYGIHAVARNRLEPVTTGTAADTPAISTQPKTCLSALFLWRDRRVSFLSEHRLFDALRQRAL
ncbi:MAG: chemotaxis protein CheW [Cyanobacteria bacterium J06649_5]